MFIRMKSNEKSEFLGLIQVNQVFLHMTVYSTTERKNCTDEIFGFAFIQVDPNQSRLPAHYL